MDATLKASMGDELYDACIKGNLDAVTASIAQAKAANPSFSPPLSTIMYAAASQDHVSVVKYCLDNGAAVNPDMMRILLINRARELYIFLLETKAVDVNYYIPWWGNILSDAASSDDLDWAKLCLDRGADPNQNLVDEHKASWRPWPSSRRWKWRHYSSNTMRASTGAVQSSWLRRRASWTW